MRHSRNMLLLVAVLTLGLASFAAAQMMMGNSGNHMSATQNDTVSQSATMDDNGYVDTTNPTASLLANMTESYTMMTDDFNKLQTHFNKMMQINDMKTLKAEMQKHQQMMKQMHDMLKNRNDRFTQMATMMGTTGMGGMMGVNTEEPTTGLKHNNR